MNDAARCLYLVCYDIANPRRLRQVHKFLLGYKVGGQKSFFECWLTSAELKELRKKLGLAAQRSSWPPCALHKLALR